MIRALPGRGSAFVAGLVLILGPVIAGCSSDPSTVQAPSANSSSTAGAPTASTTPGSSASSQPQATGMQIAIQVGADGKPVGGVKTVDVPSGETFTLTVTSAVADEVHLHGYDVHSEVAAGGTATITHKATIPGEVVAELEGSATTLVRIRTR